MVARGSLIKLLQKGCVCIELLQSRKTSECGVVQECEGGLVV
jgi:hypothetical protein